MLGKLVTESSGGPGLVLGSCHGESVFFGQREVPLGGWINDFPVSRDI